MNRRDSSGRNGRYFIASTMIVVGLACAAVLTDSVGNDLATVLIGLGLILFVAFLFKDLGISIDSRSAPRVPSLPAREGERGPAPASRGDEAAQEQVPRPTAEEGAHEQRSRDGAGDGERGGRPAPTEPAADAPRSAAESARRLAGRDR